MDDAVVTITGRPIREARTLLGLTRSRLAYKVGRMTTLVILRAEEAEDEPVASPEHAAAVRRTLERSDIQFMACPPGVRLRSTGPT